MEQDDTGSIVGRVIGEELIASRVEGQGAIEG